MVRTTIIDHIIILTRQATKLLFLYCIFCYHIKFDDNNIADHSKSLKNVANAFMFTFPRRHHGETLVLIMQQEQRHQNTVLLAKDSNKMNEDSNKNGKGFFSNIFRGNEDDGENNKSTNKKKRKQDEMKKKKQDQDSSRPSFFKRFGSGDDTSSSSPRNKKVNNPTDNEVALKRVLEKQVQEDSKVFKEVFSDVLVSSRTKKNERTLKQQERKRQAEAAKRKKEEDRRKKSFERNKLKVQQQKQKEEQEKIEKFKSLKERKEKEKERQRRRAEQPRPSGEKTIFDNVLQRLPGGSKNETKTQDDNNVKSSNQIVSVAQKFVSNIMTNKEEWIVACPKTRISPGEIVPLTVGGLDLLVVASKDGSKIYAIANSCPHLGTPLELGLLEDRPKGNDPSNCEACIVCPTHQTAFALESGEVRGEWCPYPPVIGKMVATIKQETPMLTFDVRTRGKNIEVRINSSLDDYEKKKNK